MVGSIETLVSNLVAELTAAQGSPNSDARIQAIIDKLAGDKTRLAQLVAINTPAQTELPPDGVTQRHTDRPIARAVIDTTRRAPIARGTHVR